MMTAITSIGKRFGRTAALLRLDNLNEFLAKQQVRFLEHKFIWIYPTTPYKPQEKSFAERIIRAVFGRVRATLLAAQMDLVRFWRWCTLDTI